MATAQVRKQVYDLSAQDFLENPIWEFCSGEEDVEGQDEATVKPSEEIEILGYSPGAYIVAAKITYANGSLADGYLYSGKPDDFACLQPNVLLPSGQLSLWLGSLKFLPDWREDIAHRIAALGTQTAFPMSFETRANVNGSPLRVVAPGFFALDADHRVTRVS